MEGRAYFESEDIDENYFGHSAAFFGSSVFIALFWRAEAAWHPV
jgi:hypothetical protein